MTKTDRLLYPLFIIPVLYLAFIWPSLEAEVPIHYDFAGDADGFGDKRVLLFAVILLPFLTYVALLTLNKRNQKLRSFLLVAVAVISFLIVFMARNTEVI